MWNIWNLGFDVSIAGKNILRTYLFGFVHPEASESQGAEHRHKDEEDTAHSTSTTPGNHVRLPMVPQYHPTAQISKTLTVNETWIEVISIQELWYIHTAGERDWDWYRDQMECRNVHTGPRQERDHVPLFTIVLVPFPAPVPVPFLQCD